MNGASTNALPKVERRRKLPKIKKEISLFLFSGVTYLVSNDNLHKETNLPTRATRPKDLLGIEQRLAYLERKYHSGKYGKEIKVG